MQDLKLAVKSLIKSPGYVAISVLSLALGLGGATALFSLVDAVLLRPLSFPHNERLYAVQEFERGESTGGNPQRLLDIAATRSVEYGAGYYGESALLEANGVKSKVLAIRSLGDFHQVFAVPLEIGRYPTKEEGQGRGKLVAVLSHGLWRRLFQERPEAIGSMIRIEKDAFEVVGVYPKQSGMVGEVWTNGRESMWAGMTRTARFMTQVLRLREGVSREQASAEFAVMDKVLAKQYPNSDRNLSTSVLTLLEATTEEARRPLFLVWGVMLTVFLIACVNVAGLTLARSLSRGREAAIRMVLGATTPALMKRFFAETLLIVVLGLVVGLAVAFGLLRLLQTVLPADTPRLMNAAIDWRTLLFGVGASFLAAMLAGVLPIWQAVRKTSGESLRGSSTGALDGASLPVRSFLVTTQIALSTALLVLAGLTTYAFVELRTGNAGFVATDRFIFGVDFAWGADPGGMRRLAKQVRERLLSRPGVAEVAVLDRPPMAGGSSSSRIVVQGKTLAPSVANSQFGWRFATPEFTTALGTKVLRGRTFTANEGSKEVVVTQSFARQVFGSEDPVGRYVAMRFSEQMPAADSYHRIVGVIEDIQEQASALIAVPAVFSPWQQAYWPMLTFVVHAPGQEGPLMKEIRGIVRSIDPQQEVARLRTLEEQVGLQTTQTRTSLSLIGSFALLALVLSCIGLYGLLEAQGVKRQRDIGIRLAVGATPAVVRREALWRGVRFAGLGVLFGVLVTALTVRLAEQVLPGLPLTHPAPYVMAVLCLVPICLLACWVPALRAGRVDPMVAIRQG